MMNPPHATSAKGATELREPSPAQRAVARRTAEARATIPDIELSVEVEMDAAPARLPAGGLAFEALLLAATARGLRAVPQANGAYRDGRFETYSRVNIGLVLAEGENYAIPTVFDADEKTPAELERELSELLEAARARTLPPPAFSGATFTVWNAGALGLSRAGIVINPPQAGALAAGALREVPVVRDGQLTVGRRLTLTLACDHRILYGARAAALLGSIAAALQEDPPPA